MKDFNGKVVVVTGGATGIGFALAKQFGAKGAKLVLAARRRNRLDQAASELSATGVEVRTFECDVTQRDQVEALADFAWKEFGTVDVIVNNAGHGSISSPVIEAKHEDVQNSQMLSQIPFQPDWLMEALGVVPIDTQHVSLHPEAGGQFVWRHCHRVEDGSVAP